MKAKLAILIGCIAILLTSYTFACGGGGCGGGGYSSSYSGGCGNNDYGCSADDNFNCSDCQCTDDGYAWNDCISKSEYCEAFGNPGAR